MSTDPEREPGELERRLDAAARFEREVLDEAGRTPAPGEERFIELAHRQLGVTLERQAPRNLRPWLVVLVAAAATLLLMLVLSQPSEGPDGGADSPRGSLLGGAIELETPLGAGQSFARFTWRCERSDASAFRVLVYDADDPAAAPVSSPRIETTQWEPDAAQATRLPRQILWEVRAESAIGEAAGSSSLESASRLD